jgi:hypothetical protein
VPLNLYLDLNIYNRPFDDQRQARIRLETSAILILFALLEPGRHESCWSFVLDYENSQNPVPDRAATIWRLAQICRHRVIASDDIRELARRLIDSSAATPLDALHLACAEIGLCDYLVTCDDKLVKQAQMLQQGGQIRVRAINPVDLVRGEVL